MIRRAWALAVVLCLSIGSASAQSVLPEHVYRTLVEVCDAYPYPVVQSDEHLGEILNAVAYRHRDEGWGLSRKAGGRHVDGPAGVGPIAEDILQLPNGNHYDVLGAAAAGNPLRPGKGGNIGTINLRDRPWVAPVAVRLSWATGGSTPVPPVPTPVPPASTPPPTDLRPVLDALARLQADVDELKGRPVPDPAPPDAALATFINDMTGTGPNGVGPHVTDLKERLDVIRVALEQLDAWLRGRRALKF